MAEKKKTIRKRMWRSFQKDVGPVLAPSLGVWIIRAFGLTMKKEVIELGPLLDELKHGRRVIIAFWHGRMLMLPVFFERYIPLEAHVLIGFHTDAEIISRVIKSFGLFSIRGSSKKGGKSAGLHIVRMLRKGDVILGFTPDGPKGPGEVAKRGLIELAYMSRAVIVPVSYAASRQIKVNSWDKFVIPLPFSRTVFVAGKPLEVTGKETKEEREALRREIERRLIDAGVTAEKAAGSTEIEMRQAQWEKLLWGGGGNIYRTLSRPLAAIYGLAGSIRARLYEKGLLPSYRPQTLTVSVGNITPGGSGKTPLVMALSDAFTKRGLRPVVITRGYGGSNKSGAIEVNSGADPSKVGDEPAMMAAMMPDTPLIKAPCRKLGAKTAESTLGADVLVLDDAFGHLALARDFDIILVDAIRGFGNCKPMPAGPLREPISELKRADCIIITHTNIALPRQTTDIKSTVAKFAPQALVLEAIYRVCGIVGKAGETPQTADLLSGRKVVVFSGIGNPTSFHRMMEELEVHVVATLNFSDHHPYATRDLEQISHVAKENNADYAVTTEKDLARLGERRPAGIEVVALKITLEMNDLECLIDRILKKTPGKNPY